MARAPTLVVHLFLLLAIAAAPPTIAATTSPKTQKSDSDHPLSSPRLAALAAELASAPITATEKFWAEMPGNSPLVEPDPDDSACSLVTFVWRGDAETRNVGLIGGPVIHDFNKWLQRLGASDIWYRTERIPNTARFTYSFQVNRPDEWPIDVAQSTALWLKNIPRPDPLNANSEDDASVVELPDAPPEPWLGRTEGMSPAATKVFLKIPGVPRGAVQSHVLRSSILKQDRRVDVYTPINYDATAPKPYKLLVLFEGSGNADLLDNLAMQKRIPPVVMVVPHFIDRNAECACSETFADFVADELLPWVRDHYHVTTAADETIIGGFSFSGLAAAFCAFRHPDMFGNVLTMSGSYWWFPESDTPAAMHRGEPGWLTRQFVAAPLPAHPPRFFLAAGAFEDYYPWSLLAENRRLRDVLAAKGYAVTFRQFTGGHDPVSWRGSLVEGLIALTREPE